MSMMQSGAEYSMTIETAAILEYLAERKFKGGVADKDAVAILRNVEESWIELANALVEKKPEMAPKEYFCMAQKILQAAEHRKETAFARLQMPKPQKIYSTLNG